MQKLKVYCASGFITMSSLQKLVAKLKLDPFIQEHYEFIIPQLIKDATGAFVHSDLYSLQSSDILLIHMPQPSIGAAAEFGYFKAIKPNNLIICYKCLKHDWLMKLSSFMVNDLQTIKTILYEFIQAKHQF